MNVRKVIEDYEYYDGKKAERKLSASQASKDLLELYLYHTEEAQPSVFGKGEIGSIFHLGMEEMFKSQPRVVEGEAVQEVRQQKTLSNGWVIDGKSDMVDFTDDIIYDWKGMSASAYAVLRTNKRTHRVNMQMAVYRWLFGVSYAETHCFITNWDPCNPDHPATAYQIFKPDMYEPEEIEALLIDKTDLLDAHLAALKIPPKCTDVMPRRLRDGTFVNSKCMYYCNYSHVCKRKRDDSAAKLGLSWGR